MSLTPHTFFKCLGDETRARIMLMLSAEGELCVCELIWALDDNQSKVSGILPNCVLAGYSQIGGRVSGFTTGCIPSLNSGHWMF